MLNCRNLNFLPSRVVTWFKISDKTISNCVFFLSSVLTLKPTEVSENEAKPSLNLKSNCIFAILHFYGT